MIRFAPAGAVKLGIGPESIGFDERIGASFLFKGIAAENILRRGNPVITIVVKGDIWGYVPADILAGSREIKDVVLEVKNLVREPHTRNVSFQVRAGEIVGLAGLVGSGRSETAQVIFGILSAQSGEILINGKKLHIHHPSQAVKHGIAYVPEDRGTQGLVREMNIRENISMAILGKVSSNTFINYKKETDIAQNAITQFGIRAYSTEQITNNLSGGNQHKVVVGKWLSSEPRLLIIDEPTRGVDVGAKSEIHRLMSELAAERGIAILMISSELPEILGMSDRVLVMRSGEIVAEFSREEATQEKIGSAMMSADTPIENVISAGKGS